MSTAADKPVAMTAAEARALGYDIHSSVPDTAKIAAPKKAFVATDGGTKSKPSDYVEQTVDQLKAAGVSIIDGVPGATKVVAQAASVPDTPAPDPI